MAEREALQKDVFPKLEDYCARNGARFQVVDLRWGITEEAQRDRETMQICLEEIRRCQALKLRPNFAVLLGHRYGWVPVPARILKCHWYGLIEQLEADKAYEDISILNSAYRLDENTAPPTYCLRPEKDAEEQPLPSESAIKDALQLGARNFEGDDRTPYFASATHQEIKVGALAVEDASNHVHVYKRHIDGLPEGSVASDYVDWDQGANTVSGDSKESLSNLETQLRTKLGIKNIHEFRASWNYDDGTVTSDHLQDFCDSFYEHQKSLIDHELQGLQGEEDTAVSEQHHSFATALAAEFTGRNDVLDQISAYLRSPLDICSPLVAVGEGGMGKTSIVAKSYLRAVEARSKTSDAVLLCRFIGGVAGMETLQQLLESLVSDISLAYGQSVPDQTHDIEQTISAFESALGYSRPDKPLSIFIDALDQLDASDTPELMNWLPRALPDSVSIVLSTRPGLLPEALLAELNHSVIEIGGMSEKEGADLLNQWLDCSREAQFSAGITPSEGRRLTNEQRDLVLRSFMEKGNSNPLWLRLAYEKACRWHSWDQIESLPGTIEGMVRDFLEEYLIEERKHLPCFTGRALGYIAAGRYGLSEDEVAKALGTDETVRKEFEQNEKTETEWKHPNQLPPILWSRLFFDLQPYLTSAYVDGALVYRYFHKEFQQIVEGLHLRNDEKASIHTNLAEVFSEPDSPDLYRLTDASGSSQDSRALRRIMEQPWHLVQSREDKSLRFLLMDFAFCMAKCAANRSDDLVNDHYLAQNISVSSDETWKIWAQYIKNGLRHILRSGDCSWPSHRIFLQLAIEHGNNSPLTQTAEAWLKHNKIEWQCLYIDSRPEYVDVEPCIAVMSSHSFSIENVEIMNNGNIVSWSENETFLKLWCGISGTLIRKLTLTNGLGRYDVGVSGVKAIDDHLILSWAKEGSVVVWDGDTGSRLAAVSGPEDTELKMVECIGGRYVVSYYEQCSVYHDEVWWFYVGGDYSGVTARLLIIYDLKLQKTVKSMNDFGAPFNGLVELRHGLYLLSAISESIRLIWFCDGQVESISRYICINEMTEYLSDGLIVIASGFEITIYDSTAGMVWAALEIEEELKGIKKLSNDSLVLWSKCGNLKLWNRGNPKTVSTIFAHDGAVEDVEGIPDHRIFSWGKDARLKLWDIKRSVKLVDFYAHSSSVVKKVVYLREGVLISWSECGQVKVWRNYSEELFCLTPPYLDFEICAHVFGDGDALIYVRPPVIPRSGFEYKFDISIFEAVYVDSKEESCTVLQDGHFGYLNDVSDVSNTRFVSCSDDGTIRLWCKSGKCLLRVFRGHRGKVNGVLKYEEDRVISWGDDGCIRVWDCTIGENYCLSYDMSNAPVEELMCLGNGKLLSISRDKSVGVLDEATGRLVSELNIREIEGQRFELSKAFYLSCGNVVTLDSDGNIILWDSSDGEIINRIPGSGKRVKDLVAVNCREIVSLWVIERERKAYLMRLSGDDLGVFSGLSGFPRDFIALGVMEDGKVVISSADGDISIWEGSNCSSLRDLVGKEYYRHLDGVTGIKTVDDKCFIAWSYADGMLSIWSMQNGEVSVTWCDHGEKIHGALVLPDKSIVSYGARVLALWESSTGEVRSRFHAGVGSSISEVDYDANDVTGIAAINVKPDNSIVFLTGLGGVGFWSLEKNGVRELRELGEGLNWLISPVKTLCLSTGAILAIYADFKSCGAVYECVLSDVTGRPDPLVLNGHSSWILGILELDDKQFCSWSSNEICFWDSYNYNLNSKIFFQNGVSPAVHLGRSTPMVLGGCMQRDLAPIKKVMNCSS